MSPGASADCGKEIAAQVVAARVLAPTERLQLVGRKDGPSARVLHGLVCDLTDAHAEYVSELDVALSPEDVVADVWIVAAGVTMPTQGGQVVDRQTLARGNAPVFSA
jgi:malate dehydrogenase